MDGNCSIGRWNNYEPGAAKSFVCILNLVSNFSSSQFGSAIFNLQSISVSELTIEIKLTTS